MKTYHSKLSCSNCHGSKIPYKKLDNKCSNCHVGWNSETFKHSVTGLQLDETHTDFECSDCHAGEDYSKKPSCDGCHDDMIYPQNKPGKTIK
ncbi:MAG: cytochrome c3 family protein [Ignavibacteriaceae bacterium]|nr:cytochrome c3 family protein [Ignavibacteriaceae bacterium]